jgi:PAS domain S-box-containing protein
VALIGLVKLLGCIGCWDPGMDQWLFAAKLRRDGPIPNHMAPNAALNFFLLGGGLLLADRKKPLAYLVAEILVIVVGFGSLLALLSYAYGTQSFYRLGPFIPMSLVTAIGFSALVAAFLLSHTDGGMLAIFAGKSAGGKMARHLMPAVILLPVLFGWLELQGERAGIFNSALGNAMFAMAYILFFTLLVSWSAQELFRAELERKKAREELRESEIRFRSFFEQAAVGFAQVALDGRFLLFNQRYLDIVGRTREELQDCTFQEITHPDDLDDSLKQIARLRAREIQTYSVKKRYLRKDGAVVWANVTVSMMSKDSGQARHLIAVIQDITESKRTDDSVRGLAAIVENSNDAIISKTLDGIITSWNPAAEKMFGYTAAEIIGQPLQVMIPPDHAGEEAEILAGLTRGELVQRLETVRIRKDGRRLDVSVSISAIKDSSGHVVGTSKIVRDITDRKRFEAQLLQSQKLETVGKLAGGIAHEFNSLLTAIIGQSELLFNDLAPGNPLRKNATEITHAAGQAAILTRQLLAYGRKQILQPKTLDLNSVLAGMESALRHLLGPDRDVRLVPGVGLKAVKADAGQIDEVIMNLAMNALDAMPAGGKLTLETANVTLDHDYASHFPELKAGEYVMLAITDTGVGMSEQVKARVFEPFFTTKAVGQGIGLGLATCYGIIKQSGGHIGVYSELGRGTTVKIYLPQIHERTKISLPRLDSPDLPRGTESVLLVEDNAVLREMATTLLRRLGYTVFTAVNGVDALSVKQQPETGRIDLLCTDVVMPDMDGIVLAEQVRELYPPTKILFTSAYTENAVAHQGVLNEGAALLQKPFTPGALAHKLRELLDTPSA